MRGEKSLHSQMEDFALGRPALVCRWRLADRALPLENRHLRALSRRVVGGSLVSPQLVAWAKQHIEWTLADGAARYPDGVLMTIVDERGRAAMTVGPYEPLPATALTALAGRAVQAAREAERTEVAPETLWAVRGDQLVWGTGRGEQPSGAATLVSDLAKTVGITVVREEGLAERALTGTLECSEAFLVSDEHGIVAADGMCGPRARRLVEGYARLLDSVSARRGR